MRTTVTIARELGCGGSATGQRLAELLSARCLDREIVSQAAKELDWDEGELTQREERRSSFWERMLRGIAVSPPDSMYVSSPAPLCISDEDLFAAETRVMKEIAAREDCVIVGRAASYVLSPHPGMVNLFLHAPLHYRIQRLMDRREAPDHAEARALIARSDGARKTFIAQMANRVWDEATNYHLCVDTSALPFDDLAQLIADFVRCKIAST